MNLRSRIIVSIFASAAVLTSFVSNEAMACGDTAGWVTYQEKGPRLTIEETFRAAHELRVVLTQEDSSAKCSTVTNFNVHDLDSGRLLGQIPLSHDEVAANDGQTLAMRLAQLLKTSRTELAALIEAEKQFDADSEKLAEQFGVRASLPYQVPTNVIATPDLKLISASLEVTDVCTSSTYHSPERLVADLKVKTTKYIPGREGYPKDTIYAKNDLENALVNRPDVMTLLRVIANSNIAHCDRYTKDASAKWRDIGQNVALKAAARTK